MRSVLDGVTAADIRLSPFPHVVKTDVFDEETWRALSDGFPPFSMIGWSGNSAPPSNQRYQLSAWMIMNLPGLTDIWREFARYHSSREFYAQVVALFRDYWAPELLEALDGDLMAHETGLLMRDSFSDARILQDARAEINTPVTGPASSSRGAHLDTLNRMFTCLYYLRHPDDDARGGDLELFRWKSEPIVDVDTYELPRDAVEVVATVPYRANQMVIFPQGIDAIHGVGIRHPTPHTRRYVFISAEIEHSWLTSPVRSAILA